jgi:hypothetical protein
VIVSGFRPMIAGFDTQHMESSANEQGTMATSKVITWLLRPALDWSVI